MLDDSGTRKLLEPMLPTLGLVSRRGAHFCFLLVATSRAIGAQVARSDPSPYTDFCTVLEGALTAPVACNVAESGVFGVIGDREIRYVLYRLIDSAQLRAEPASSIEQHDRAPYNRTAVAMFWAADSSGPFWWEGGNGGWFGVWYERPRLLASPANAIIALPKGNDGMASVSDDVFLQWYADRWRVLDTNSWLDSIQAYLPDGLGVRRVTVLDLENMRTNTAVWRSRDADCCPSGGSVSIQFTLRDSVLTVASVEHKTSG